MWRSCSRCSPSSAAAHAARDSDHSSATPSREVSLHGGGAYETSGRTESDDDDESPFAASPSASGGGGEGGAPLHGNSSVMLQQLVLEALDVYYRVRLRRGGRLRDCARLPRAVGEAVIEQGMMQVSDEGNAEGMD